MADELEFDPDAFIKGEPQLPKVKPKLTTFYYPETPENTRKAGLSYSMEGGVQGGAGFSDVDLRNHTLEKYKAGESDFVAVAAAGRPTGEKFRMEVQGEPIVAKRVDTGGGLRPGQIDIAVSNPELARTGIERGGGFDPDAFVSGKPQPSGQVTSTSDTGGFDPDAFIGATPTREPLDVGESTLGTEEPEDETPEAPSAATSGSDATPPPEVKIPQINQPFPMEIPIGGEVQRSVGQSIEPPAPPPEAPPMSYFAAKAGVLPAQAQQPPEFQAAMQTPLVNPQMAKEGILAMSRGMAMVNPALAINLEALKRLNPQIAEGVLDSAAEQLSGMSSAGGLASAAPLMMPGVGEEFLANEIMTTPQHWSGVQDVINRYGLGSRESTKAMSNEVARMAMAGGVFFGRKAMSGAKAQADASAAKAAATTMPETGWTDASGNIVDVGTGTRESPPQFASRREIAQKIARGHDSVFTESVYQSNLKVDQLRQEFGFEPTKPKSKKSIAANRDLEAMTFIEEAQGVKENLIADAKLIAESKNKKLAKKYEPILKHAIDNFDRLSKTQNRYKKLMQDQLVEDATAGIQYGEQQGYVTHLLKSEPPSTLMSMFSQGGSGGGTGLSRYFTKHREFNSLAEAINAGVEPRSVNLADLAQHRIAASRRLILQKALFNELRELKGPDGRPAVSPEGEAGKTPMGYDRIVANGVDINVHPDYAPIFKALYGDSAFRRSPKMRALMRTAGVQKAYTLAADTFHGFRGIYKGAFYGGKGSRIGYNRGTTVYELSDAALKTEVERGNLTESQAQWAKSARPAIEAMLHEGLNVSRYADNIVGQMHVVFPGTKGLNNWIFQRVFRGAMIQASHANFIRNTSRFPELSRSEVAAKTAREMNQVFGNLMSQGLFKDKTVRDALNVTFLAPQWVESQVRSEFLGYGQLAKVPYDLARGKARMGVVAQGQATSVAAFLIGNQLINYATTGHSTFENEGNHKLAAYLPIGDRGVYLDPLALSAEYVGRFAEVMHRQGEKGTVAGVVSEMARGKLSNMGRSVVTLATGRDYRGRALQGRELYTAAATELIPAPIAASAVVERNPKTGFSPRHTEGVETDRITQQILQSMGLRASLGRGPEIPYRLAPQGKGIRGSARGGGIRGSVR